MEKNSKFSSLRLWLVAFLMILSTNAFAQKVQITGTVLDASGVPIIGASVVEAGATNGSITDVDGHYTLSVDAGKTVKISYIGCETQEFKVVANKTDYSVQLKEDSESLNEIIVTAYGGKILKAKVTNSISKVDQNTLSSGIHSNPAQALSGAVAGLRVQQTSGDPGATPTLTLRGGTGLDGSGSPLVIVDGAERSMSDINPADIESMEVMKDAGSTAIYGARAANGVILITTKHGKEGHTQINLKAKLGLNYFNDNYNFLNARDYLYWMRTAYYRSSHLYQDSGGSWKGYANYSTVNGVQPYGTGNIYYNADGSVADGNKVNNANWSTMVYDSKYDFLLNQGWEVMDDPLATLDPENYAGQKLIFKNFQLRDTNIQTPALTQDYMVDMSGGNDKGHYYSSLGYNDSKGNATGNWYKRLTFTFNGDYKIRKWLTSSSSFNFSDNKWFSPQEALSGAANYFGRVLGVPPTFRGYNANGEMLAGVRGASDSNVNTWIDAYECDYNTDKFTMNQAFKIDFYKDLNLKISGSWYYEDTKEEQFIRDYQNGVNRYYTTRASSDYYQRTLNQTYNAILNYAHTFAEDHNVTAMLGAEYYDSYTKGFSASGQGAPTDEYQDLSLTSTEEGKRNIDSWHNRNRILSFFGKVDYDYQAKYLFSAVLRRDGFSRLAKDNRWGIFPGVSAGWVFSKEDFMQGIKDIVSWAKLRVSYGANGNLDTSYIGNYTVQGAYATSTNYNGSTAILLSTLPNPSLIWEKSNTFEIGTDWGFLGNRYNLMLSYYNRHTKDKIASITLPSHSGASSFLSNNGEVQNQGIEFEVRADIIKSHGWNWNVSVNGAWNKNKIISLPYNGLENNRQNAYQVYTGNGEEKIWVGGYQEGQSYGDIYAFKAEGIYSSYDEIPGNLVDKTSGNNGSNGKTLYGPEAWSKLSDSEKAAGFPIQPGDVKWKDVNNDGVIDNYDMVKIGSAVPKVTGGLVSNLSYQGFTFTIRADYALGYWVTDNRTPWILGNMQGTYNTVDLVKDTWTTENTGAKYPMYVWADQLGKRNYARSSSMFIYRGDYLALREISLSYSFPQKWIKHCFMNSLVLSISGQNLGYLTAAKNMASPEYGANSMGGYSLPRTLIFGINVGF